MSIDDRTAASTQDSLGGHRRVGSQDRSAAEGSIFPQANSRSTPLVAAPAEDLSADPTAVIEPWPEDLSYDLRAAAATFNDVEHMRVASENRLRQFVRPREELDKDGKNRGFGWKITDPAVQRLANLVEGMLCSSDVLKELYGNKAAAKHAGCCTEHDALRNLTRALRAHPLGAWVRSDAQMGIGEKQGARLIGIIGDPYVRPELKMPDGSVEPMRVRTPYELHAYCGYGEDSSRPGRIQRRQRGQTANWSAEAKMRAHLIAEQCMKSGLSRKSGCERVDGDEFATHTEDCQCSRYRLIYDRERVRYADAVHEDECIRCGPSGKPAAAGTPLSLAHKKGRALRRVSKEILDDLWREARRIHEETPASGQSTRDAHASVAAGGD